MGMNPETNKFEELSVSNSREEEQLEEIRRRIEKQGCRSGLFETINNQLLRPDGTPVPKTWSVFKVGESVTIKNYNFKVAYIGETSILFEPFGPTEAKLEVDE